jgi:hypothetical protein
VVALLAVQHDKATRVSDDPEKHRRRVVVLEDLALRDRLKAALPSAALEISP